MTISTNVISQSWYYKKQHKADLKIVNFNKPGTAQVGAISKAQKDSKTTFSTTGGNRSSQKKLKIEKKNSDFFSEFFWSFR